MNWIPIFVSLLAGFTLGITVAFVLKVFQTKKASDIANEIFRESEARRTANLEVIIDTVKSNFGGLASHALSKASEDFLRLAKVKLESERAVNSSELESKKELIDQQLLNMKTELEGVSNLVRDLEKDRIKKFGELSNQLKNASDQTNALMQTTNTLREALSSAKSRGQWGERMAEDVLRMAGFIENVNYLKQKSIENVGTRPDFTFLLPKNLNLNMDVKFPFDNYIKYLESDSETEKSRYRGIFLRDVRIKIKEVTTRDYISPEQKTVDYVILFIPNEQIFSFIHEQDSAIFDEGIKSKVIFCSPISLFAVLAVIRQAVDNFTLEQTSNEILSLLGKFFKQWKEFNEKLKLVGEKINNAQEEYDKLTSTRLRKLEVPLKKIEALRTRRELSIADLDEVEDLNIPDYAESEINDFPENADR